MAKVLHIKWNQLPSLTKKSIITIGMFDSFHKYHQLILHEVIKLGDAHKLNKIILTFDHKPNDQHTTLLSVADKVNYLQKTFNFDYIFVINISDEFLQVSAPTFIDILQNQLQVVKIVEGSDFKFGYQQSGDIALLQKSFGVENVHIFMRNNDVSTSKIKSLLDNQQDAELATLVDHDLFKKH